MGALASYGASWLAGWLAGRLAGWLACCVAAWLAGWLSVWLAGWLSPFSQDEPVIPGEGLRDLDVVFMYSHQSLQVCG